jgi:NAD(P)-dependent dehydrogenase (short-subunit alcohol dehydrogenase family)
MKGIITGGTRGLGYNIAEEMAKEGYTHLILTFNSNVEAAEKATTSLESKYDVKIFVLKGDIGEESTVDQLFKCVEENFGNQLNAFVHNAGAAVGITSGAETDDAKKAAQSYKDTIGSGDFKNFSTYDYFQNIYPKCFIRCVEQAVKIMEDGKGYIIAVSTYGSNVLQTPKPGYAITAQAKGCMELLVSCLHYFSK